jgi:S-adenosyl-L-methionine hydrolase (adenosine-forming)
MLDRHTRLLVKGQIVSYARTFSEMQAGEPFWYENANGLVEIAMKEASAAKKLSLAIGDTITRAMTVRS